MKTRILFTIVFSLITILLQAAQAQISGYGNFSELQGKTCKVTISNKIKFSDTKTDELTFSLNEFSSSICSKENMHIYSKDIYFEDGKKHFTIEFKCDHNDRMIWEGTINKNNISGVITSVHGNKNPVTYLFSGVIESVNK